jgi:hypothetical protein
MLEYLYNMYVLNVCSKCFIWNRYTLQVFYLDLAKVDLDVTSTCFKCFQMFHTYVCKYFILMLHMFAMVFK